MAFDADDFDEFLKAEHDEEYKKAYTTKKRDFPYLKMSQLPEGRTVARLLPPVPGPEKCPEGYLVVATHTVSMDLGEQKHPRVSCIFRRSTPCYICDTMKRLAPVRKNLSPAVQEAIVDMDSDKFRCIAYPISLFAEPIDPDNNKSDWKSSTVECGAMLQVYAQSMLQEMGELQRDNPNCNHEERGFYFEFWKAKGNKYRVKKPDNAVKEPVRNQELLEKWRKVNMVNAFYKDVKRFTYDQQADFLRNAWWMKDPQVKEALAEFEEADPFSPSVPATRTVGAPPPLTDDYWD